MHKHNLISVYTKKQKYQKLTNIPNKNSQQNIVARKFNNRLENEVFVSDLTYVKVGNRWAYICLIIDLFNREIVGHSVSFNKDAKLVYTAFSSIQKALTNLQIFHTDRGSEFNNYLLDDLLKTFNVKRSLSRLGNPYDNAVAESTYKIIKTEFIRKRRFASLEQLKVELFDYVNWYNSQRIHSHLKYNSPNQFKSLYY